MKTFRSAKVFVMAESVIFYAKWCDDYDSANGTSLRLVFVELYAFICLKLPSKMCLIKIILGYFLESCCRPLTTRLSRFGKRNFASMSICRVISISLSKNWPPKCLPKS